MHDAMSYAAAIDCGISITSYRKDTLRNLGEGRFPGRLDALVWSKPNTPPMLLALVTLEDGHRVLCEARFKRDLNDEAKYQGFLNFRPGQDVHVAVEIGPRGGLRTRLHKTEDQ